MDPITASVISSAAHQIVKGLGPLTPLDDDFLPWEDEWEGDYFETYAPMVAPVAPAPSWRERLFDSFGVDAVPYVISQGILGSMAWGLWEFSQFPYVAILVVMLMAGLDLTIERDGIPTNSTGPR